MTDQSDDDDIGKRADDLAMVVCPYGGVGWDHRVVDAKRAGAP
jgi:hypothetical protein